MSESMGEVDGKANVGKRIVAVIIDGISFSIVNVVLVAIVGWALAYLVTVAIALYVFGWRMGETGVTPGKQVMGLKVVDASTGELLGNQRGLQRAGLHWGVGMLGSLPALGILGMLAGLALLVDVIIALVDDRGQRYTDKLIGSIVVDA